MKTCGHVSSRDKKMQPGSYFVMRAGLRNNEFCLRGLILLMLHYYARFILNFLNLGGGGGGRASIWKFVISYL